VRLVPRRVALPILLALALALYVIALGGVSIWDANEAFYVETPREMMAAHDYINPSFNYLPRFNKPVLSYWIVAAFYELFGVSVGVQRLPIALGAMIIIGCAFVLGRMAGERVRPEAEERLDGGRRPEGGDGVEPAAGRPPTERAWGWGPKRLEHDAALWAAVGLAAAPRLVMFARRIFIDIWITAFTSLTLVCFALSERYPDRRRLFLALMYVCVGLGVLTKGPVAIALPGLSFALYLVVNRELGRIRDMMIPLGALIVAAIVVPWYAALYHQHGWTYITSFFIGENLERYTSGLGVRQQRGLAFYLPVVFSDSFPISAFLVAAAAIWYRERQRVQTLLWCWIIAIVIFFSFSAGKQDLYIFPIVAAVAGLGGAAVARTLCDRRWHRWSRWSLVVTGLLLAGAGAAVLWLFVAGGRVYDLRGAALVGLLGLVCGVATLTLAVAWRSVTAMLTLCAGIIAIDYAFVCRVLPDFERYKPVPAIAAVLGPRLQPTDVVANYQVALPSMVYYLRRHVDEYFDQEPFVRTILSSQRVYAVLSADDLNDLHDRIGPRTCILYRRQIFDVKLRNILAREPLPELLLITNQCQ
jgi:4-amino-4-deoxy-L-arabinose transferase-like glycosyltransferase